jgi:hypothetical protein
MPRQQLVIDNFNTCLPKTLRQRLQTTNQQRRMRLSRCPKVWVHAEMNFQRTFLEPHATASSKGHRFLNLRYAKQSGVELASCLFLTSRHCELDVIDSYYPHRPPLFWLSGSS